MRNPELPKREKERKKEEKKGSLNEFIRFNITIYYLYSSESENKFVQD